MCPDRLSALDTSFLEVESPTAHMHVGFGSLFAPPAERSAPSFEELRDHIASRLHRAPRFRQKLAEPPLRVTTPVWVDDDSFDVSRHIVRAEYADFTEVVDRAMSTPLDQERPLWEFWIADRLADGRLGVVGKAHHCMVDGLAAVEMASLLLDATADPPPPEPDGWRPEPAPGGVRLMAAGVRDMAVAGVDLALLPARLALSPADLTRASGKAVRAARALVDAMRPAPSPTGINEPISPQRHLETVGRPLEDLKRIKRHFGTTINDVVLATAAGALRRFALGRGEAPCGLKTMVPVSVRGDARTGELGNRISFVFIDLPCDEPDPARRLEDVHVAMSERKDAGEPEGAEEVMNALEYAPRPVQAPVARLVSSPRTFNLTVSNIPGPREPLYMLGCRLEEAYPVVPIADRHDVSIGMTTIGDGAFYGVYADARSVPDADLLARGIDEALDELLAATGPR